MLSSILDTVATVTAVQAYQDTDDGVPVVIETRLRRMLSIYSYTVSCQRMPCRQLNAVDVTYANDC